MLPYDRVLVAIMNSQRDWALVQDEGWYRIPVKHAPEGSPHFDWLAFYFTKTFGENRWAIHYYAPIEGHELVTRRDLFPSELNHPRAGQWYYKLQLGPLQHKIPPIVSARWRRVTFIVTTGDRFMNAHEINDLFEQESPAGQLYVRLKELSIPVERGGGSTRKGSPMWLIWPCPLKMAGCRSPLAIGPARPIACASRQRMSRMFVCGRSRSGCAPSSEAKRD
jgi:hypothetical protein